jgi:CheY-like chemotaxis protein
MGEKFDSSAGKPYNPAMSNKTSVLIAEDNPAIVDSLKYWFSKDYTLVFVNNINGAIEIVKNGFVPEVALVDWHLKSDPSSDEIERLRLNNNESFGLIKYLQEDTDGRCRTLLISNLEYTSAKWFIREAKAWGYFSKTSSLRSLKEVFDMGFLKDDEIGKPMIFLPYVEHSIHRERE